MPLIAKRRSTRPRLRIRHSTRPRPTAVGVDTRTLTTTLDRAVDELALAAELDHPEYLCSSHILVDTAAEAEEIVTLLDEGADFATLAIERSGDGSAAIGGDLGCGPTIGYVSEFSDGGEEPGAATSRRRCAPNSAGMSSRSARLASSPRRTTQK